MEEKIKKNNELLNIAKILRRNMTRQEKHLWYDFLSTYDVRFQRQKAIGDFIVDFYCHKAKLVIEIDGRQHYSEEGIKKEIHRTLAIYYKNKSLISLKCAKN